MAVFLVAASRYKRLDFAESLQKQTACQLGEQRELPYFKQFPQSPLALDALYRLIDEQIEHCLQQAGWQKETLCQIPIFLGSTGYVIADCEARLAAGQPLPDAYSLAVIGSYLQARYQTKVYSLATSCTASAQGIYYASQMLAQGWCDKALVIGFEPFNRLTFEHFHAMHLLAETNGEGIVLGEGLGCVALSSQANADLPCELLGVTGQTDFDNLTNNSETALKALIEAILQQSAVDFRQVLQVKPHLVGGNFDEAEKALLQAVFPQAEMLSPKAELGHTLGASGAVETAWLWEHFREQQQKNGGNRPLAVSQYSLCYFLGFGGSNVGWVLKFY
ncbi:beta-ketoacyl synthase N-terminal-like domain-containing protein [Mannheimia sp. E30BD]|uniref:beta-ketoacyl synthase N-terminal-like domain-containing protein n=1 Tax=Mannheimia sp. E30BD TaxID=3278708 RepID=UPI00359CD002